MNYLSCANVNTIYQFPFPMLMLILGGGYSLCFVI